MIFERLFKIKNKNISIQAYCLWNNQYYCELHIITVILPLCDQCKLIKKYIKIIINSYLYNTILLWYSISQQVLALFLHISRLARIKSYAVLYYKSRQIFKQTIHAWIPCSTLFTISKPISQGNFITCYKQQNLTMAFSGTLTDRIYLCQLGGILPAGKSQLGAFPAGICYNISIFNQQFKFTEYKLSVAGNHHSFSSHHAHNLPTFIILKSQNMQSRAGTIV